MRPLSHRAQTSGGLRKTRPRAAAGRAGSRRSRGSRARARSRATRVSSRARCMPRHTWGPWANANLEPDVVTPHVEPVGLGEHGRVAIGTRERDGDEIALSERHACELRVARHVPVDDGCGGLEAERLLDRCREQGRARLPRAPAATGSRAGAGTRSRSSPPSSRCRRTGAPRRSRPPAPELSPPVARGGGDER